MVLCVCCFYFFLSSDRNRSHLSEKWNFGEIARDPNTGRAELHGPCWPSVKKGGCPRPPDTGRAGLHGGPCGTPDFTMGFGFGELHGPCWLARAVSAFVV